MGSPPHKVYATLGEKLHTLAEMERLFVGRVFGLALTPKGAARQLFFDPLSFHRITTPAKPLGQCKKFSLVFTLHLPLITRPRL
jgi:hypothetical protein